MGKGNWIQLTSGGGYDFETKTIFGRYSMERDLAYSLAGINRYASHSQVRWPVAIHSVAVARLIEKMTSDLNLAAAGLLHDAHESVIGDIPTPVSRAIDYKKTEELKESVQLAIENTLGVPELMRPLGHPAIIKMADVAALHIEKQLFMVPEIRDWGYTPPPGDWAQAMYDIMLDIIRSGENGDGGEEMFKYEYGRLITERLP